LIVTFLKTVINLYCYVTVHLKSPLFANWNTLRWHQVMLLYNCIVTGVSVSLTHCCSWCSFYVGWIGITVFIINHAVNDICISIIACCICLQLLAKAIAQSSTMYAEQVIKQSDGSEVTLLLYFCVTVLHDASVVHYWQLLVSRTFSLQ